jgi:osmotically-inducible protein OsmY
MDDASVRENVLHVIHAAPDLEREDIEVSVVEGWVTLRGAVDAYGKKRMAEDLTRLWAGIQGDAK